jgi:predicted RecB family endonuclease
MVDELTKSLVSKGFAAEIHPKVGEFQPDIVFTDRDGVRYLVEVQLGNRDVDLGSVAYVSAARRALQAIGSGPIIALLATTGSVDQSATEAAKEVDVEILVNKAGGLVAQLITALTTKKESLG